MNARTSRSAAICAMLLLGQLAGCSTEKDEKGAVENMSDKVADKAVEQIQKPLEKAHESQALQNAQAQQTKQMVEESEPQRQN